MCFAGKVSPVLAQPRQQHHLRGLYGDVPQRRRQLRLPGPGDDAHAHTGKRKTSHTQTGRCRMRESRGKSGSWMWDVGWRGRPTSEGFGWVRGPGGYEDSQEVCFHGDRCRLFFFWMLHAGLRIRNRSLWQPTPPHPHPPPPQPKIQPPHTAQEPEQGRASRGGSVRVGW